MRLSIRGKNLFQKIILATLMSLIPLGILWIGVHVVIDIGIIGASEAGDVKAAHRLLKLGANPNALEEVETKETALMVATINGHLDVVEELLRHGANPNLEDEGGGTALQYAINYEHPDIATMLRKAGATR